MSSYKYSKTHEWIDLSTGRVGITNYARTELGDIIYTELCNKGEKLAKGDVFGHIESVKAYSDVTSPMSGTVKNINEDILGNSPDSLNNLPETEGWLIQLDDIDKEEICDLLCKEDYEKGL